MKRFSHQKIFSSFHTLYRLTTTSDKLEHFVLGVAKIYRNIFKPETVVIICKCPDTSKYIKVKIQHNQPTSIKKGGISLLSKRERTLLKEDREIISQNRLMAPYIFQKTLGGAYLRRKSEPFTDQEQTWFISLSEQITSSFKIINLYLEEKRIIVGYINAISQILSQYVPTAYVHYKSISRLIKEMGKALRLTETEIKSLEYAILLHDAGKIHLPQKILKKQEPLTEDEYQIIMKHPKKGIEFIKELGSLKSVVPIILHHHERYDGKGYPSKLKKQEIPLGSRILSIIDAFDAMFFGRPYKGKMTLEEIEKEFIKQKGVQFDPDIINTFLKVLKKKSIRKYLNSLA